MSEEKPYIENWSLKSEFNLRTILDVLKIKWHWFVLSIVLCLGVAYVYTKSVPVFYKREAVVQLKNEVKTEEAFNEKQIFNDNNYNIDGEILIFKSRLLMQKVIERLGLDIGYSVDDGLKSKILYTDSPLAVSFPDSTFTHPADFTIIPLKNDRFRIKGLEDDPDGVMEYSFGKLQESPIGRMLVTRTTFFSNDWLDIPIRISCVKEDALVSSLLGGLEAERSVKDANLITLTYQDMNPKRGDDILNTLIQVYVDESMGDKNMIIRNTAAFIDERLQLINQELGNVEGDIEEYRKRNQSVDFGWESRFFLENRNQYDREIADLTTQIELIGLIQQYLHDPLKEERLLPVNTGITNVGIEAMIEKYNIVLLDRDKLKINAGDNSPAIKERNEELASLRRTISESLRNTKDAISSKLDFARHKQMLEVKKISNLPTQQKYVLSVERQQKIKEELFLYLLNKREENALTLATADSNLRIVDDAYDAGRAGANTLVILLGALIVGLFIPSIFFYLQQLLDVKVRGRRDIEDNLTIPFLGEIPRKSSKSDRIVVRDKGQDPISESFRIIRANLDFMLEKKSNTQSIMFTSFSPDSGKTFISSNLAVALALAGKRVILLEMDIRKGSEKDGDGKVLPGLTNYLSGNITDIDSLIRTSDSGFDVIVSGPIPPNPTELLLGNRLDQLMAELRDRYEYILLDTVPYGVVADAQVISRVADLCVYVIRERHMDRRLLPEVEKLYATGKLPHMAVILNEACYQHAGYGYYGSYGYYGYGNENKKKK